MADTTIDTPGQQTLDTVMSLGRVIADLCISSNLRSTGAIECALEVAFKLCRAKEYEDRWKRSD